MFGRAGHPVQESYYEPGGKMEVLSQETQQQEILDVERARNALNEREAQRRKRNAQAALERERKKRDDEKRKQEAREFLAREAERLQREREAREADRKPAHEPEPVAPTPLLVIRPPSEEAADEVCKCGYPGCLGHEVIDNHAIFPGSTSEAALERSTHEIVCFLVEVVGLAGNPSDGQVPVSALRTVRKRRD